MWLILVFMFSGAGMFAHGVEKTEVKVSEEELKRMAQFEKDHADKARDRALKATEIAEKNKKKLEAKNEK